MVCVAVDHGGKEQNKIVWIMKGKRIIRRERTGNEQGKQEIQNGWRK
jgi:hypothetical protein